MPQIIVFLEEIEDKKVISMVKAWDMNSKHDTIKRIIRDFEQFAPMIMQQPEPENIQKTDDVDFLSDEEKQKLDYFKAQWGLQTYQETIKKLVTLCEVQK